MATLILGTIAKNAGWNAFWSGVAAMAGSVIDQSLFAPNVSREGPRLDDLRLQTSTFGASIPKIYGTVRTECNVIWGTNYVEHVTTEKQGGGKGGGGGSVTTTSYSYSVSFAVGLCQGPISGIGRVWADGKLIDLAKHDYTLYYGTEAQTPDPYMEGIEGVGMVPAYRGLAYIVFKNFFVTDYGNRIPNLSFEVMHSTTELKNIVEEISVNAGLDLSEIDVSSMADIHVPGYKTSGEKSRRSQIEQLQLLYVFDGVERNGKVVFKQRDFTKVLPISLDSIGAYENSPSSEAYTATRMDERELPVRLTIKYLSADKEYQQGVMSAFRQLTLSRNEKSLDTEFVLTDSQAKTLADTRLYEAWVGRTKYEFSLGSQYAHILPGDILELNLANERKALIVVSKVSYGKPGIIKIQAESTYASTYTLVTRNVDPEPQLQTAEPATEITTEFLDIPRLPGDNSQTDDTIYVASTASVYYGASVFRSNDGGLTYSLNLYRTPQAYMGVTTTALASGPTVYWDNANTLDVVMSYGSLESRPVLDVLNGFNAALVGDEIIQFTTALLIAPNTYRISVLLRGRLGTEHKAASHVAGERFVLLSLSMLGRLTVPSSDWFQSRLFRVGPSTLPMTNHLYQDKHFTSQGIMALPLSPCHITGSRDDSGNLTISWIRRTRGDGSWKELVDVPLSEKSEMYEIDVVSEGTVKRTLRTVSSFVIYSADEQIADFGSVQSLIKVRIYQMSESRGRGTVREEII
ncbi:phage tail protein [Propionispora hippei]|uniref:Phage tail protein n=1 Tax=Propionispora hippei DSM 15287 TaxID=1123003 RepID=A0A1M6GS42_9FIRM|nr:phage tail protein [Propionispora hippei]SHJ12805.1 Putative phage tail protein [Propionispora hippei DSM 15287]